MDKQDLDKKIYVVEIATDYDLEPDLIVYIGTDKEEAQRKLKEKVDYLFPGITRQTTPSIISWKKPGMWNVGIIHSYTQADADTEIEKTKRFLTQYPVKTKNK
jgi:hypothetical protein